MTTDRAYNSTGADLRAHRRAAGLTQTELAALAGCQRGAVAYWEGKDGLDRGSALVRHLARLVGMYDCESSARSGARGRAGWGVTPDATAAATPAAQPADGAWSAKLASLDARIVEREPRRHETDGRRQAASAREVVRQAERQPERPVQPRTEQATQPARREPARCGALTRKGTACRHAVEPDRARCRFHGGLSTGPRTPEGRARIAQAQRRRWAAWRVARAVLRDELLER